MIESKATIIPQAMYHNTIIRNIMSLSVAPVFLLYSCHRSLQRVYTTKVIYAQYAPSLKSTGRSARVETIRAASDSLAYVIDNTHFRTAVASYYLTVKKTGNKDVGVPLDFIIVDDKGGRINYNLPASAKEKIEKDASGCAKYSR